MQNRQTCRWQVLKDAAALTEAATGRVLRAADQAIARSGAFHLVLAGGSTPRRIYAALANATTDWSRWHIWFGDERCLTPDDPERNSRMAQESWLGRVAIPAGQVHIMPAELGPVAAATAYGQLLQGVGDFDLVLLGLGEDAHTASLFPGQDCGSGTTAPDVLPVVGAPKPPPERISLSARRLSAAREVVFLVSGTGKREAVADWRAGAQIPAASITPAAGVDVLLDFAPAAP